MCFDAVMISLMALKNQEEKGQTTIGHLEK
jgi:hypothetical protein